MGNKSSIEWTDATWTPIRARVKKDAATIAEAKGYSSLVQIAGRMAGHIGPHCEHTSPGCDNCYSETNNSRCLPSNGTGLPFDRRSRDLVDVFLDLKILEQPLRWKQPRRVFVCSQTDLFGEFVTDEMIDRVFAVMALCPRHTFQVLTKRANRLALWETGSPGVAAAWARVSYRAEEFTTTLDGRRTIDFDLDESSWPLPNVWLGVSVESRDYLSRIDDLRKTPAAVRFLSLEPLLEDLGQLDLAGIHWVIVGAESGPGARPMKEDWVRSIRDQCISAGVAFFYKQNAAHGRKIPTPELDGKKWVHMPATKASDSARAPALKAVGVEVEG